MIRKYLATALAVFVAAPHAAGASEPTATSTAQPDGETVKLVCRRDPVLGSRLPGPRVCKTAEQWKQNDREAQDAVRRVQENRRSMDPGAG